MYTIVHYGTTECSGETQNRSQKTTQLDSHSIHIQTHTHTSTPPRKHTIDMVFPFNRRVNPWYGDSQPREIRQQNGEYIVYTYPAVLLTFFFLWTTHNGMIFITLTSKDEFARPPIYIIYQPNGGDDVERSLLKQ